MDNSQKVHKHDSNDWFLQNLIDVVNGTELEIRITLNVGGFLISGHLISGHKYFEGFSGDFTEQFDDESTLLIKETFSEYGKIYLEDKDDNKPRPLFIHLANAKFFNTTGNPIPNNRGTFWRGRVSEVSGFIAGTLDVTTE